VYNILLGDMQQAFHFTPNYEVLYIVSHLFIISKAYVQVSLGYVHNVAVRHKRRYKDGCITASLQRCVNDALIDQVTNLILVLDPMFVRPFLHL